VDGAAPAAAPPAVAPPAAEIAIVSVAASPTDDAPLEFRAAGHAPSSLCSPVGGSPSNGVPAAAASTGATSRHWPPRAASSRRERRPIANADAGGTPPAGGEELSPSPTALVRGNAAAPARGAAAAPVAARGRSPPRWPRAFPH
jgi:hypothetical protein